MLGLEKKIFQDYSSLISFLQTKGFVINGNIMKWGLASSSECYWGLDNSTGAISFVSSTGSIIFNTLINFQVGTYGAVVFIPLADNGCILYLQQVSPSFSINDLELTCNNGYDYNYNEETEIETWTANSDSLKNGIVVCTPAETDNKWRYSWRNPLNVNTFQWCIDDGAGNVSMGIELPSKKLLPGDMCVTLTKIFLSYGDWSQQIYQQVLGESNQPMMTFKINGQKYITLTDNGAYRAPAFRLPTEFVEPNLSTSTEEYSPLKTYKYGDYCIYNGLLWKCIQDITQATPFDQTDWVITTVNTELST